MPGSTKRKVLFPGKSCYPISPKQASNADDDTNSISSSDQLIKIVEILGKQDDNSLSFIQDQDTMNYVTEIQSFCNDQGQ